jgi:HK97 family phage major capsid protein
MGEESLLSRCTLAEVTSPSVSFPVDNTASYSTSGIQLSVESEGTALNQSKPALAGNSLRLAKVSALVPASAELVEDAAGLLDAYLEDAVSRRLVYLTNQHILSGDGINKSLGILGSGALITVTKDASQPTATISFNNVNRMWSRLIPAQRGSACWIVSTSAEEALRALQTSTGSPVLNYGPGESIGRMFGAPVICTEAAATVGSVGDVTLCAMKGVVAAVRPGITNRQISAHVWWDQNLVAYRYTVRLAAAVVLGAPVAPRAGTNSLSTAVSLEARP